MVKQAYRLFLAFIVAFVTLLVVVLNTRSTPAYAASTLSMLGADVSSLQHAEDLGAKYYYSNGAAGYPSTWTGQSNNFRDVLAAARAGGAIGVFYWEPTWIATPGNGWDPTNPKSGDQWDNQALFNWSGLANPAIALFKP